MMVHSNLWVGFSFKCLGVSDSIIFFRVRSIVFWHYELPLQYNFDICCSFGCLCLQDGRVAPSNVILSNVKRSNVFYKRYMDDTYVKKNEYI